MIGQLDGPGAMGQAECRSLSGRVAVVTGGNTGIGRAISLAFAAAGADLAINYIANDQAAHDVAHEIAKMGRRCILVQGDASSEEGVDRLFRAAIQEYGTVHIAVANAGIQRDAPLEHMSLEQWNEVIGVNLTGAFLCAREAAREFLRRSTEERAKNRGSILFITSVHQSSPWPGHANYSAAKAGVAMLMRTITQELAPRHIRVNAIAPGAIQTDINRPAWEAPLARRRLEAFIPHRRIGLPDEVAQAALWLVGDGSDYVNGATIYVDGGLDGYVSSPDASEMV